MTALLHTVFRVPFGFLHQSQMTCAAMIRIVGIPGTRFQ